MSNTPGTSQPSNLKWLEALVQQALARAANALKAVQALKNRALTTDSLDNQNAPDEVIIAAAEVTPKASGIFFMNAAWSGHISGAGTVLIDLAAAPGPVAAFSGGTVEQAGGGAQALPAVRYSKAGNVTATGGAGFTTVAADEVTAAGAADVALTVTGVASGAVSQSLLAVRETTGANLTTQALTLLLFELP